MMKSQAMPLASAVGIDAQHGVPPSVFCSSLLFTGTQSLERWSIYSFKRKTSSSTQLGGCYGKESGGDVRESRCTDSAQSLSQSALSNLISMMAVCLSTTYMKTLHESSAVCNMKTLLVYQVCKPWPCASVLVMPAPGPGGRPVVHSWNVYADKAKQEKVCGVFVSQCFQPSRSPEPGHLGQCCHGKLPLLDGHLSV